MANNVPTTLHPELARLIREEIRAGFFMDPPTTTRDLPHDIDLQRSVLASLMAGFEQGSEGLESDDFYGDQHRAILAYLAARQDGRLDEQLRAEWSNIDECAPVMVGKNLRLACTKLRELANRRRAVEHLRRALARIEVGESDTLVLSSIYEAGRSITPKRSDRLIRGQFVGLSGSFIVVAVNGRAYEMGTGDLVGKQLTIRIEVDGE
jgi:hypothetical protein